jgi:hypothetical protein
MKTILSLFLIWTSIGNASRLIDERYSFKDWTLFIMVAERFPVYSESTKKRGFRSSN